MSPRGLRRTVAACAVALVVVLAPSTADADPAIPTNFSSKVLSTKPPLPAGVTIEVVGGDAFLDLRVARGHTVTVPDYPQGDHQRVEPYLEVFRNGTVRANTESFAWTLNRTRRGGKAPPAGAGKSVRWKVVGRSGHQVWHDHRIHLMVPPSMAQIRNGRVDLGGPGGTWQVPLVVDGHQTVVTGELRYVAPASSVPWWTLAAAAFAAAAAVAWLTGLGRLPKWVVGLALVGAGALALIVAAHESRQLPDGAGGGPLVYVLPAVGLAAALVAIAIVMSRRPMKATTRMAAPLAAAVALGWWAIRRLAVFSHSVLPSGSPTLDRVATAVALGVAAATIVSLLARPSAIDGPAGPAPERS